MSEFKSLSGHRIELEGGYWYSDEAVKEFVKRVKVIVKDDFGLIGDRLIEIDELAGGEVT